MTTLLVVLLIQLATVCLSQPDLPIPVIPPETVDNLVVPAFLGRWYQMYTSLLPSLTFEEDGYCVTADYFNPSVSPGQISFDLLNSQTKGSPTGPLEQAEGTATNRVPFLEPGKYMVDIEGGRDVAGFFWIVETGEIDPREAQYPWVIISVPFQVTLFVLARDPDEFNTKFKDIVLEKLKDKKFIFPYNKPIETFQSSTECNYAPTP